MRKNLLKDSYGYIFTFVTAIILILYPSAINQFLCLIFSGLLGGILYKNENQNYNQVNRTLLSMDNKYRIIAESFLMDLNYMIALKRIDSEILAYLSNNK